MFVAVTDHEDNIFQTVDAIPEGIRSEMQSKKTNVYSKQHGHALWGSRMQPQLGSKTHYLIQNQCLI